MTESTQCIIENAERLLPAEFIARLQKQLSSSDYQVVLKSISDPKPVTIRPNTLRATEDELLKQISSVGMETEPVAWCPQCHLLTKGTIRQLQELPLADSGGMYIQAASSMLAAYALQVEPTMRVLDMCAAPGSKTSLLSSIMQNKGMLVANDRSRKRLYKLREILQKQGATNVEILCGLGEQLPRTHADCFDRVLVDAPCSGEGRFRLDKPIRLSRWSVQEIRTLSKLQEQLLVAAMRCVAVGGIVVYSTCTFAPEENECVLDKVLSKNTVNAELVEIPISLHPPSSIRSLQQWNERKIECDISHAIRIIPDASTTGFFMAALRRIS